MSDEPKKIENESGELAHFDDAVIGRAMRWSILVIVILGAVGGGVFFLLNKKSG